VTSPPFRLPAATREEFVESAAILLEEQGLIRMSGRTLAWLMICDPPHQSAAQLAAALSASAGSISATTRELVRYGLVDRVAFTGDRKDYFLLRPGIWWHLMQSRLQFIHDFWTLAERGREIVDSEEARQRLDEVKEFYEFLEEAMRDGLKRWQTARQEAAP